MVYNGILMETIRMYVIISIFFFFSMVASVAKS